VSTIIDALKQAERESKNILSEEESEIISEKKQKEGKKNNFGKFLVITLILTAFAGAGTGGWFFYSDLGTLPSVKPELPVKSNISFSVNPPKNAEKVKNKAIDNLLKKEIVKKDVDVEVKKEIPAKSNEMMAFERNKKGIEFYESKKLEEAKEEFISAVKFDANLTEAHFNLALVYEEMDVLDKAIVEYRKAVILDSGLLDAYINLGVIYNKQKKYSESKEAYERVLKISPNEPTAHFNLGILYAYYLKKPVNAILHWKKYMKIKPGSSNTAIIEKEIKKLEST